MEEAIWVVLMEEEEVDTVEMGMEEGGEVGEDGVVSLLQSSALQGMSGADSYR